MQANFIQGIIICKPQKERIPDSVLKLQLLKFFSCSFPKQYPIHTVHQSKAQLILGVSTQYYNFFLLPLYIQLKKTDILTVMRSGSTASILWSPSKWNPHWTRCHCIKEQRKWVLNSHFQAKTLQEWCTYIEGLELPLFTGSKFFHQLTRLSSIHLFDRQWGREYFLLQSRFWSQVPTIPQRLQERRTFQQIS